MLETWGRIRKCVIAVDAIGVVNHDAVVSGVRSMHQKTICRLSCFPVVVQCVIDVDAIGAVNHNAVVSGVRSMHQTIICRSSCFPMAMQ
jgi:hypothetical protein